MEVKFKFGIGDIVYHKLPSKADLIIKEAEKTPFFVLERILQECPGGIQIHYKCRCGYFGKGMNVEPSNIYDFNEIELEIIK